MALAYVSVVMVGLVLAQLASCSPMSSSIPDEKWGYVTVREHAHMFWWFYGSYRQPRENVPLVMWLQGGPGGSSCGFGNFAEMGPLDTDLRARNTTWLQSANLLFVDNPVGAGFSYVTDPSAYTTNVTQIADDLLTFMKAFLDVLPVFREVPFYIFTESYGGKMTAAFGALLHRSIQQNKIECNFKGAALGDSWVSPVDSVLWWGQYLYNYNLLDMKDLDAVSKLSSSCADAVNDGQFAHATDLWADVETLIDETTDSVNVYNVLQHHAPPFPSVYLSPSQRLYNRHVGVYYEQSLADLMNGPIRRKLKIIPASVKWGDQSGEVFAYQKVDFMKHNRYDVDTLLSSGLSVTVFQGQLDMICNTPAAEAWIHQLKWPDLSKFYAASRVPLYTHSVGRQTQAFLKKYSNFQLFFIMDAGHMVPKDNGPMALKMLRMVIGEETSS